MNDRQVLRAAARQITHGFFQIVIKPRLGWAVKLDAQTQKPALPIVVEPAPDIKGMLSQLKVDLDGIVAEQKRRYDQWEAKLATMDDAEKALLYSKKGGEGLFNATIGSAIDLVKSLPGLAKKAAGVWWKFKNLPLRLANSTVDAIRAGSWGPLKREVHQIVGPVVQNAEQLKQVTSMVAVLLSEQVTRDMLLDFVDRYWDNTHPLEKTEMGAEAASEVVMNILLAIFTAGVGVVANLAAKSGRLVKVGKLLQKIAAALKRVSTFRKMPKKQKGGGVSGFFKKKKPKKKGVLEPRSPKKKVGDNGPKKTAPQSKLVEGQNRGLASTIDGEPMDAARFARMKKAFEQNGGKVLQGEDVDDYMKYRGVEGITDNSKQILLKSKPSTSSTYEEFIHATQHRTGRYVDWVNTHGNQGAEVLAEIEVAEKLIRSQKAYKIPKIETEATIKRLKALKEQAEKLGLK